jgi:hypothetical protein
MEANKYGKCVGGMHTGNAYAVKGMGKERRSLTCGEVKMKTVVVEERG